MLVILFAPHCLIYVIKLGSLEFFFFFFISLTNAGQLWQQRDDDHDEDNLTQ